MAHSKPTSRRRLSANERRQTIVAAAADVFGELGYHGASIRGVAARTGVSKPVIYDHFSSKQDLYIAVLHHEATALLTTIAPEEPSQAPLEQRLARTAYAMASYARARPQSWRLLFIDTVVDPTVEDAYRALRAGGADIAAQITASDPDFSPPPGVDRDVAAQVLGHLQHSAYGGLGTWAYHHPDIALDHLLAAFMDFAWIGLKSLRTGDHWHNGTTAPTHE